MARAKTSKLSVEGEDDSNWFSIQLKPVGSVCNLRCKYCYAKSYLATSSRMSYKILELVIKKCIQSSPRPTFSWHGGEPTLAGYDFFRKAMQLMDKYKKPDQEVRNLIQTNATLITGGLARLFKKYNFGVSVSLDGPEDIQGLNRVNINNVNSFSEVIRGIKLLRESGNDPAVIATVTKVSLPFAAETFDYLVSLGFKRIKYSPVYDSFSDKFSLTTKEWFGYLKVVFQRWMDLADPSIQVRDLDEVIAWISNKSLHLCATNRTCLNWISIDPTGGIYPCEYLKERFYYGNIESLKLAEVQKSKNYLKFQKIYKDIPAKCQKCKFFDVCGNGCPATRVNNRKLTLKGVYVFCEQRKLLYKEISTTFKEIMEGGVIKCEEEFCTSSIRKDCYRYKEYES